MRWKQTLRKLLAFSFDTGRQPQLDFCSLADYKKAAGSVLRLNASQQYRPSSHAEPNAELTGEPRGTRSRSSCDAEDYSPGTQRAGNRRSRANCHRD